MDNSESFDFGRYLGRPTDRLLAALTSSSALDTATLEMATAWLIDRVITLLRTGTIEDLLGEALALHAFLERGAGAAWRSRREDIDLERLGSWSALGRLLSDAARKKDAGSLEAFMRSFGGKAKQALELLISGEPRSQAALAHLLQTSAADLESILHAMEDRDLILRHGSDEHTTVSIAWLGRKYIYDLVAPLMPYASIERANAPRIEPVEGQTRPPSATTTVNPPPRPALIQRLNEAGRRGSRNFYAPTMIEYDERPSIAAPAK